MDVILISSDDDFQAWKRPSNPPKKFVKKRRKASSLVTKTPKKRPTAVQPTANFGKENAVIDLTSSDDDCQELHERVGPQKLVIPRPFAAPAKPLTKRTSVSLRQPSLTHSIAQSDKQTLSSQTSHQQLRRSAALHAEMLTDICNAALEEAHLLQQPLVDLAQALVELDTPAKALLLNIYNRTEKWIRITHNSHHSFDAEEAAKVLVDAGIVLGRGPDSFHANAMMLTAEELKNVAEAVLFGNLERQLDKDDVESPQSMKPDEQQTKVEQTNMEQPQVKQEEEILDPLDPNLVKYPTMETSPTKDVKLLVEKPTHQTRTKAARMLNIKLSAKKEVLFQQLLKQVSTQCLLHRDATGLVTLHHESRLEKFEAAVLNRRGPIVWLPKRVRDCMETMLILYLRVHDLPTMLLPGSTSCDTSGAAPTEYLMAGKDTGQQLLQWPLLSRIGVRPCPDLSCPVQRVAWFADRRQFEQYCLALKLKQQAEMLFAAKDANAKRTMLEYLDACDVEGWFDLECSSPCAPLANPETVDAEFFEWQRKEWHCGRVLAQMLDLASRAHRSLDEYHHEARLLQKILAQNTFATGDRPRLFARLALVLQFHLKQVDAARTVCLDALADPFVRTGHRQDLLRRLKMVEDALQMHKVLQHPESVALHHAREPNVVTVRGRKLKTTQAGKSRWKAALASEQLVISVEALALEHYRAQGYDGAHWEGRFVTMIVGLACLDVLLDASVVGAFAHKDSCVPVDLYSGPLFAKRRQASIDALLVKLEQNGVDVVLAAHEQYRERGKQGASLWGVDFSVDRSDLEAICACLGNAGIRKICETVLPDVRGRTGGFPDLTCWKLDEQGGTMLFVEVKGPGDKLMKSQEVWLETLASLNFEAHVCKVEEG